MIDPFTLFQPLPAPPVGVATWVEIQMLEAARVQAAWAANQAYWSRFGSLTQLAAFIAAGAAAWFTWNAAQHARVQADAAQEELKALNSSREVESIVQAWAMWVFLDDAFDSSFRTSSAPASLLFVLKQPNAPGRRRTWNEIREDGVKTAARITSPVVLPGWIDLFDAAVALVRTGEELERERERAIVTDAYNLEALLDPDRRTARQLRDVDWARSAAKEIRDAERLRDDFWRRYDALMSELDKIGRGGRILSGSVGLSVTLSGKRNAGPPSAQS